MSVLPTIPYFDALRNISVGFGIWQEAVLENVFSLGFMSGFLTDLQKYAYASTSDLLCTFILAITWTFLRVLLEYFVKPFAASLSMGREELRKFPESAWKFVTYVFLWSLTIYTLFFTQQHHQDFFHPEDVWKNWIPGLQLTKECYAVYLLQTSFYLHSIYGTLFMDEWRKDSVVMVFHHVLTIALLVFSYVVRYHRIGLIVLFLHDVNDICLELGKLNVYLKTRGGGSPKYATISRMHDLFSEICFFFFSISWYIFRLHWLPLKVLTSTGYFCILKDYAPNSPFPLAFYLFFNLMLWSLFSLHIYWFRFILKLLFRALCEKGEVNDVREQKADQIECTKEQVICNENSKKGV